MILTPREQDILVRLADGKMTAAIAHELGISARTVEQHRRSFVQKMEAVNTTGAVVRAFRLGLIH